MSCYKHKRKSKTCRECHPEPWCKVRYIAPPYDSFGFELYFDCAPPETQLVNFGLGEDEAKHLYNELGKALKKLSSHTETWPVPERKPRKKSCL